MILWNFLSLGPGGSLVSCSGQMYVPHQWLRERRAVLMVFESDNDNFTTFSDSKIREETRWHTFTLLKGRLLNVKINRRQPYPDLGYDLGRFQIVPPTSCLPMSLEKWSLNPAMLKVQAEASFLQFRWYTNQWSTSYWTWLLTVNKGGLSFPVHRRAN